LPDKTVTILNTHSTIKYPGRFADHERDVQLNGEAWFNVTRNHQQPFIITTGPIKVKVVGTSFNVRNAGQSIEVAVKTGIVRMISAADSVAIHPGEKGIYDTLTKKLSLTATFNPNEIGYATKVFNFENATLKEIAGQLEKAYGITIVIKNEKLLQCTMSSTFDNKPIEYIFDVLAMTLNIRYQIVNKTVYISGNSCT
jgi:ferric-dicitrate binding protein FerR (iron transport regulator)